jgi:ribonuclease HII
LNDSKKLTEKKRDELYKELIEMSRWKNPKIFFWLGLVDNFIIDEINIKQANKEAMRRAIVELSRKISPHSVSTKGREVAQWEVLIDWRDNYDFEELKEKPTYIIWGDWKISEIWAASIIAKVFRDKILLQYATLYPDLWIENHKWYWTKKHKENLVEKKDITWIHRLSYKPVKKVLEK